MSVPVFIQRVADAVLHNVTELSRDQLIERISRSAVRLTITPSQASDPSMVAAFQLAADLAARLYPRVVLGGPDEITEDAAKWISQINPQCDLADGSAPNVPTLAFGAEPPTSLKISVQAAGWNIFVDCTPELPGPAAAVPAALAAAAVGMAELFRMAFSDLVPSPRRGPQPGSLNLVTLGDEALVTVPTKIDLGEFHLAGAGAIGHACALTIAESGATGTMTVVDPETLDLTNVQRYVRTTPLMVGAAKTGLVAGILSSSPMLIRQVASRWAADGRSGSTAGVVLVGLDSDRDRIAVQAGLPRDVYNAWTQPLDVGWSRHEAFGDQACLACLYWPTRPRPNRHELIGMALGIHPIRALVHLATGLPVGSPLPAGFALPPGLMPPPEAGLWLKRSVLDDIAAATGMPRDTLAGWESANIDRLYREGACGGALLSESRVGLEAFVPLAHQSALAGIMLGAQLMITREPELAALRPPAPEGRFDVLMGLPQHIARPRAPTPACICQDVDFVTRWRERWTEA